MAGNVSVSPRVLSAKPDLLVWAEEEEEEKKALPYSE